MTDDSGICSAEVVRRTPLNPSMVRITFGGPGLESFVTTGVGDEYLRVFFPHGADRQDLSLPFANGADGWDWPEGAVKAPLRTYTVRAVRREPTEIDIDFVIHDGGVAAGWAATAGPGDVVGLNRPSELYAPPTRLDWQLLVADQAGLPAVGRLLTQVPDGVRTKVVVEVPDAAHELTLPTGPGIELTWIHGGNGHGPSRIADVVRSAPDPTGTASAGHGYIWVAGETSCLRAVRKHLRHERGLPAERYKVVGYWTQGAEQWEKLYEALPESVREELMAMWSDTDRDIEEIEDDYADRLERLGL